MTCFYIVSPLLIRGCNFPFDRLLGMLRAGMFLHLKLLVRYLPLALIDLVNEFEKTSGNLKLVQSDLCNLLKSSISMDWSSGVPLNKIFFDCMFSFEVG